MELQQATEISRSRVRPGVRFTTGYRELEYRCGCGQVRRLLVYREFTGDLEVRCSSCNRQTLLGVS